MKTIKQLNVKIFADGADKTSMLALYKQPYVSGFTTNPTLMHNAGVQDYEAFARDIVKAIPDRPISFEVFSDDFNEMHDQARLLTSLGKNVYVKIPCTNTKGEPSLELIRRLGNEGVKLNITAIMTAEQVLPIAEALAKAPPSYISVFAGRVADTGRDPLPIMKTCLEEMAPYPHLRLIWASPRELLNIFQADDIGCHIITVTPDILKKLNGIGKDLNQFSLETVKMFREDAVKAGFTLSTPEYPAPRGGLKSST